ncbi:MAG: hypothetical protein K8T91_17250 [Planctomycetes bacterium]|nr:hypothetical protein [Planctomycetota bacterium]
MAAQATNTRTKNRRKPLTLSGQEASQATQSVVDFASEYAKERPEVVALWAFGIGFVLGWKLKLW